MLRPNCGCTAGIRRGDGKLLSYIIYNVIRHLSTEIIILSKIFIVASTVQNLSFE